MAVGAGYYVVGALASILIVVVLALGHVIRPGPSGPDDD
jgi:hypothetical protein